MRIPLLIAFFFAGACASAQLTTVTGTVRDSSTGEPLPAAHIRLIGTGRGTIANASGQFQFALEPGMHRLAVTMLGYRTDTMQIALPGVSSLDVALAPSAIVMPEVVVTSEDPALEIIRRAIANKRRWIDRLLTYRMEAFTRQTLFRDTSIASISEAYTRGAWRQGDTLRETVIQKKQTANVSSAFNFASVGGLLNFNDERIRFVGYAFVGPTALDALDYYDYTLLRTRSSQGRELYEIRMLPKTRTKPLFEGTVTIENDSYALAGIAVKPNEAFVIPFVKTVGLQYRQQFGLYERAFWLPVDIRVQGSFDLTFPGVSFPRFGFSQTSVIYDYAVNVPIPDSVFGKPRLSVDSLALMRDTTLWTTAAVLPLNPVEQRAYRTLDSTQKLEVQFRPGGIAASIGGDGGALRDVFAVLKYVDFSFNRVEGFRLGATANFERLTSWLDLRAGWSYAFSQRRWIGRLGSTFHPGNTRAWGIGGDLYRANDHRPDRNYYDTWSISIASLLEKEDYRDYYRADGWRTFVYAGPERSLRLEVGSRAELHEALQKRTDYSLLFPSQNFRDNPAAARGMLRSIDFTARFGREPEFLDAIFHDGLELSLEHASSLTGPSAFRFTRYTLSGWASVPTSGEGFLFRPGFRARLDAGVSSGTLPTQRFFDIESAAGALAPFGAMRATEAKEFSGTGFVCFALEHNFRSIPFLALGIPFLYENGTEFLLHGGAARSWGPPVPGSSATDGWYTEAGFSVSRIFQLLRADFTWRFHSPRGFAFTIGAAPLL